MARASLNARVGGLIRSTDSGEGLVTEVAVVGVALACAWLFTLHTDDLHWLVKVGDDILRERRLPEINRYSFTAPDFPWTTHEWATEVLLSLVSRALGQRGLFLLGLGLFWATVLGVAAGASKLSGGSSGAVLLSASIAALTVGGAGWVLSPHLLGRALLAVLLAWLWSRKDGPSTRDLILMAGLFCAWVNLHGSYAFGVAVTAGWAAFAPREHRRSATALALAAVAGSLISPYGVRGAVVPLLYLGKVFSEDKAFLTGILAWQPLRWPGPGNAQFLLCTLAVVVALTRSSRSARERIRDGLMTAAFAVFALRAFRGLPDLGVVAAIVVARHVRLGPDVAFRRWRPGLLLCGALLAAATLDPVAHWLGLQRFRLQAADFGPPGLLAHLRGMANPPERLFNELNWGGALIRVGAPHVKVFIDQRNDCYPPEVLRDFRRAGLSFEDAQQVFAQYGVQAGALRPKSALAEGLRGLGWRVEYEDRQAVLLMRPK